MSSNKADARDFLVTRRARITPQQAGLQFYGADYYTRLEKGNLSGVSDSVLEAIAGALQLNEAERLHLFDLARTASTSPARRSARPRRHDRHPRVRAQRPPGHPRRQHPRPGAALTDLR